MIYNLFNKLVEHIRISGIDKVIINIFYKE